MPKGSPPKPPARPDPLAKIQQLLKQKPVPVPGWVEKPITKK